MKKTIILILFAINSLLSGICHSQYYSGGNDSLLFDGGNTGSTLITKTSGNCKVKVTNVSGIATGTRCVMKVGTTCGEPYEEEVCETGQIFPDDKLKAGDKISTGPNGYLTIMLSDGKTIRFGHNTSIVINSNYCDNNFKTQVQLEEGELYINARPNRDIKGLNVITEWGTAIIEGTEFSYSIIKEGEMKTDVLRVFEGSVSFGQNMENTANIKKREDKNKKSADMMFQLQKLTDDYNSGKFTAQEFTKKMQDLQNEVTESLPQNAIIVNEGFESKIVGTDLPTEPSLFDTNSNRWWE